MSASNIAFANVDWSEIGQATIDTLAMPFETTPRTGFSTRVTSRPGT